MGCFTTNILLKIVLNEDFLLIIGKGLFRYNTESKNSLLDLWPVVDFLFTSMTWPIAPLHRCSVNLKSLSSLR